MLGLRINLGGFGEFVMGRSGADLIAGGNGNDFLFGGRGADTFQASTGQDRVLDFTSGEDKIDASGFSPWTVRYDDMPDGLLIRFGDMGGDSNTMLLSGVHNIEASDFIFG